MSEPTAAEPLAAGAASPDHSASDHPEGGASWKSPLLSLPGAVEAEGVDAGVAAHYGNPYKEQQALLDGNGFVDLSHRGVIRISGPDRLSWLHLLTTQHVETLPPHQWVSMLTLSAQGHIERAMSGYDDGSAFWAHVEPGAASESVAWLDSMRFINRVEVTDVGDEWAVMATGPLSYEFIARDSLANFQRGTPCGVWALEALRVARGEPRFGLDTDQRAIPNEMGLLGTAVHMDKGCYCGQETVARIHNLGRPPRRLVLLHLDGSVDRLPAHRGPILRGDKQVGFVGSTARHFELGPIALGLIKRNVGVEEELLADGVAAAQEVLVDPDIGLHARPKMRS